MLTVLGLCIFAAEAVRLVQSDVPSALHLHLLALNKGGHFGRWRVDGAKAKDVKQEDAAVVEQVADRLAHKLKVGVGKQRNLLNAVNAVNPGEDAQHGEVPVLVNKVVKPDGGKGHVVGVEGRGRRVGGEELNVEGVGGVNGDHGLGVVVQVLEEDLAEGVDAAAAVPGQELALLLERAEEGVELPHHGDVGAEVGILGQNEAEVEGVGVAGVAGGGDVLRVGEDAVVGVGQGEEAGVAEGRVGDDEGGDGGEVEEGGGGGGGGGGDGDGYGGSGDLVEDFGAWRGDVRLWRLLMV